MKGRSLPKNVQTDRISDDDERVECYDALTAYVEDQSIKGREYR